MPDNKSIIRSWSVTADTLNILRCPHDGSKLKCEENGLQCTKNIHHFYPVKRSIPRFVPDDGYVESFSYEWTVHHQTQLDSYTGDNSSAEQFFSKTGLTKQDLAGKLVLDAGVGAGRYSDIMTSFGANVFGVDLSFAVDSAWNNLKQTNCFSTVQADISKLPFEKKSFDFIVSIGVLHHTPDTRRYFEMLVPYLKPGGEIAIWVYPDAGDYATRARWIPFVSRIPQTFFYTWCRWFVPLMHSINECKLQKYIQKVFPYSNQGLGLENDILDTFDGYSPKYHGVHTPKEVHKWFSELGMENIHSPSEWDTCMRGRKPL